MRSTRSYPSPAILFATLALGLGLPAQSTPVDAATRSLLSNLPARFVPNQGQWASPEHYRVTAGGLHTFLEDRGWSFWLREQPKAPFDGRLTAIDDVLTTPTARRAIALRMQFVGAGEPTLVPGTRLSGHTSYFLGAASQHRSGVPAYDSVRYDGMYEGIDVRVREGSRTLEYDLLLAPGADLGQVRIRVSGARALRLAGGTLVIDTELGPVRQPRPKTWSVAPDGSQRPVPCDYVLLGADTFGFRAPDRNASLPLVVDPPILYSTYIGGSAEDGPNSVDVDSTGKILVGGYTQSLNFPTVVPLQARSGGGLDGYIIRIDPTKPPASQVEFATYIGGALRDSIRDVRALPGGFVAFAGQTESTGLPVTGNAIQKTHGGGWDGLFGVLSTNGRTLVGLTYFGGSANDFAWGVVQEPNGQCVIAGRTFSTNLPTTKGAYQPTYPGNVAYSNAFIAVLPVNAATLTYSSFLGGTNGDEGLEPVHVSAQGVVTLRGGTSSSDFPMSARAFKNTNGGGPDNLWADGVVVQFQPDGTKAPALQLVYSSYIGGNSDELLWGAAVSLQGHIVLTGTTRSVNFPVSPGAYQQNYAGGGNNSITGDGFVMKLDPSKSGRAGLVFSTFLGGQFEDQGLGCVVDTNGDVTVVGWTQNNSGIPTTPDAHRRTYGFNDGWVARLSADGTQLLYGSLLGGTDSSDGTWLVASNQDGVATTCGALSATNLPIVNGFQPTFGGGSADAWVTRIRTVQLNTLRYGAPTRGSNGVPTIHALDDATANNAAFGVACSRAPANKPGFLMVSVASLPGPQILGARLHVDLSNGLLLPVVANGNGEHSLQTGYPAAGLAAPVYVQYAWAESASALSASDALQIK